MKLAIASDHAGFELKKVILEHLKEKKWDVADLGAYDTTPSDYPDFAVLVGNALREGRADRGILVCGSGVGVSVAANKIPGVRAGLCHDSYSAHQGVEHDDMNVLVLGARVVGVALAQELVDVYLAASFSNEERHLRRLNKVKAIEAKYTEQKKFEGANV
jgi:ribose 5-phosphate isomerase B